MAHVYLARQEGIEGLQRDVVIKLVRDTYVGNAEVETMFLDEARLLAALNHPNIAQVFDLGRDSEAYYLVMEHIDGVDLKSLLTAHAKTGHPMPMSVALRIGRAIGEALWYLHQSRDEHGRPLNVVHRDITPANVMIGYQGAIKLIDFGIAKAATRVYETRAGVIKGTFGYSAPEQVLGRGSVDHRADVFSLSVLLFEMITGRHPFYANSAQDVVARMVANDHDDARSINPTVPQPLSELLSRNLRADPGDRCSHAGEFVQALSRIDLQSNLLATMADVSTFLHTVLPPQDGYISVQSIRFRPTPAGGTPPPQLGSTEASDDPSQQTRRLSRDSIRPSSLIDAPTVAISRESQPPSVIPPEAGEQTVRTPPLNSETTTPESFRALRPSPKVRSTLYFAGIALAAGVICFAAFRLLLGSGPDTGSSLRLEEGVATPAERTLRIDAEPSGARVHVDGEYVGGAPQVLQVGPGVERLRIEVSAPGHRPEARTVAASAGEARFTLRPLARTP